MSAHLIFLFLFQGGIAFGFSYFIVRVMMGGLGDHARKRMVAAIRKIRLLILGTAVIFPLAMFSAYYKSLPEEQPISLAIWPAIWILVILLALAGGLSMGMRYRANKR